MTAAHSARQRKLQAAVDYVGEQKSAETPADQIIAQLIEHHGARYDPRWNVARLTVAGVSATCTWSKDSGLLANWHKTASLRLIGAAWDKRHGL